MAETGMEIEDEDDEGASGSGSGDRQSGVDLDRQDEKIDREVIRKEIVGQLVDSG